MGKTKTSKTDKVAGAESKTQKVVTKKADGTKKTTVVGLETAKSRFDVAKKKLQDVKAQTRKDKRTVEQAAARKKKLTEQIERAKANTTKSAEELLKKAEEFEKEATKASKDSKSVSAQAEKIREEEAKLRQELAEIKAANRKKKTDDGKPKKVNPKASKVALVRALARRKFVVRYDSDGAAESAKTQDGSVNLAFGETDFTVKYLDKTETVAYGAGAIDKVEAGVEAVAESKKPKDAKDEKGSEAGKTAAK